MLGLGCSKKMVMLSVFEIMCVSGFVGRGSLCANRLKRVGKSTDHCGSSLRKRLLEDVVPLWTRKSCLLMKKLDSHLL